MALLAHRWQTGSCTNLSGGLFKGIEQQQADIFLDWDAGQDAGQDAPAMGAQGRPSGGGGNGEGRGNDGDGAQINPPTVSNAKAGKC